MSNGPEVIVIEHDEDSDDSYSIAIHNELPRQRPRELITPPPESRSTPRAAKVVGDDWTVRALEALETTKLEHFRIIYQFLDAGFTHAGTNPFRCVDFSYDDFNFLHYAARYGSENILQRVINHLHRLEVSLSQLLDQDGWNALFHAIYAGHLPNVKRLLTADAAFAESICCGDNALHFAIRQRASRKLCKLLLDHGVDMRQRGVWAYSPIELAGEYGRKDLLQLMIVRGRSLGWTGEERRRFQAVMRSRHQRYTLDDYLTLADGML